MKCKECGWEVPDNIHIIICEKCGSYLPDQYVEEMRKSWLDEALKVKERPC